MEEPQAVHWFKVQMVFLNLFQKKKKTHSNNQDSNTTASLINSPFFPSPPKEHLPLVHQTHACRP